MVTISRLVTTFFLFPFYTHTYKYIYSYNVVLLRKMLTFEDKWKLDDNRRKDTRKNCRGKIVMLKRI